MNRINMMLGRKTTRSSRIRLFQLYILNSLSHLLILFTYCFTNESNVDQPDPSVVWAETQHKVVFDYNNYLILFKLESPCLTLQTYDKHQIGGRKKCEVAYRKRITDHLGSYCTKTNSVNDLTFEPVSQHPLGTRVKRVIEPISFTLTVIAILGVAYAVIESAEANNRASKLEKWQREHADVTNKIHVELEKSLIDMRKLLESEGKKFENDLNVQAALRKIEIVEPILIRFLIDFKLGKVSNDFDYLFKNFEICQNCPKHFMRALSCSVFDNHLALKIRTSKIFDKGLIKKAEPFIFLREQSDKLCLSRYIGKKYMFLNTNTGCKTLIDFNPSHEFDAYYVFNPSLCPFTNRTEKTYKLDECLDYSKINFEQFVQHRQGRKFNHVYCFKNMLQINNTKMSTCANRVYKFPLSDRIEVNKRIIGAGFVSAGGKLDLEFDVIDSSNNSDSADSTILDDDLSDLHHEIDVEKHLDDNLVVHDDSKSFVDYWKDGIGCGHWICSLIVSVCSSVGLIMIALLVVMCGCHYLRKNCNKLATQNVT